MGENLAASFQHSSVWRPCSGVCALWGPLHTITCPRGWTRFHQGWGLGQLGAHTASLTAGSVELGGRWSPLKFSGLSLCDCPADNPAPIPRWRLEPLGGGWLWLPKASYLGTEEGPFALSVLGPMLPRQGQDAAGAPCKQEAVGLCLHRQRFEASE